MISLVIKLINVSLVELHNYARYIYFSVYVSFFIRQKMYDKVSRTFGGKIRQKFGNFNYYVYPQIKNINVSYLFSLLVANDNVFS